MAIAQGWLRDALRSRAFIGFAVALIASLILSVVGGSGQGAGVRGVIADVGNIGATVATFALIVTLVVFFIRERKSH